MTPCEELGYKVGDLFKYTNGSLFSRGATIELWEDDGSRHPAFKCVQGECTDGSGDDWAFAGLGRVKKIKETQDMIVKADGKPYATYWSAKQQLGAKGLGDTHEVVEYLGGCALARKSGEQVTLRPGDYVPTKGMTEEQYHAVAEAFMASGAEKGEYPNLKWALDEAVPPNFGWHKEGVYHGNGEFAGRQLTISQVLNATNAKRHEETEVPGGVEDVQQDEPCSSVLDTLRLAQQRVNELSHELSIAQGVRDEALEAVRAELGEGFEISVVGGVPTGVDMSDPSNWQEGDIVECVETIDDTRKGGLYTLEVDPSDGELSFKDDVGDWCSVKLTELRFHSRPTK